MVHANALTGPNIQFSQIVDKYKDEATDKHIRSNKTLDEVYVSKKASTTDLKAKIGFKGSLEERTAKQKQGASAVLIAVKNEHGQRVADLVKAKLEKTNPTMLNGITKGDLNTIQAKIDEAKQEIRTQDRQNQARLEAPFAINTVAKSLDIDVMHLDTKALVDAIAIKADASEAHVKELVLGNFLGKLALPNKDGKIEPFLMQDVLRLTKEVYSEQANAAVKSDPNLGTFLRSNSEARGGVVACMKVATGPLLELAQHFASTAIKNNDSFVVAQGTVQALDPVARDKADKAAAKTFDAFMGALLGKSEHNARAAWKNMPDDAMEIIRAAVSGAREGIQDQQKADAAVQKLVTDLVVLRAINPALIEVSKQVPTDKMQSATALAAMVQFTFNNTPGLESKVSGPLVQQAIREWQPLAQAFLNELSLH